MPALWDPVARGQSKALRCCYQKLGTSDHGRLRHRRLAPQVALGRSRTRIRGLKAVKDLGWNPGRPMETHGSQWVWFSHGSLGCGNSYQNQTYWNSCMETWLDFDNCFNTSEPMLPWEVRLKVLWNSRKSLTTWRLASDEPKTNHDIFPAQFRGIAGIGIG